MSWSWHGAPEVTASGASPSRELVTVWEWLLAVLTGWRQRRADRLADAAEVDALSWAWRSACEGVGLALTVATPTGPTVSTPRVEWVDLGPPVVLVVRLLAGQVADDVRQVAWRIAPHLGAHALRVTERGPVHVRVELVTADPLADTVPLPEAPEADRFDRSHANTRARATDAPVSPDQREHAQAAADAVDTVNVRPLRACARAREALLAVDETGRPVMADLVALPHVLVQGQTRSGKSVWTYGLLAQAAERARQLGDLTVAGVDGSGVLLRPFAGTPHADLQALGLRDLGRVVWTVDRLTTELDKRLDAMPADRDTLPLGPEHPARLVVLEEWPGVLRALDAADRDGARLARLGVARLLAEGHKVGYRVVMIAQRADAQVVGGAERAQCAGRLSFRVDNADAVRLLHPEADDGTVRAHLQAPPGVALLAFPGRPLQRVRSPLIGDYSAYARRVASALSGL